MANQYMFGRYILVFIHIVAAACLLVALVPSQPFRANFRAHSQHKLLALNPHSYR